MFFPLNRWCTLGLSVMMTLLSNSKKPTSVRVWIKYIKSKKARRQALALSSSQDTHGMSLFIQSISSSIETFFSSLVTTLRVAEKFEKSHLSSPEVAPLITDAKFFYVEGYFLTHGKESVLELSSKSAAAGKVRFHYISTRISKLTNYLRLLF